MHTIRLLLVRSLGGLLDLHLPRLGILLGELVTRCIDQASGCYGPTTVLAFILYKEQFHPY